MRRAALLPTALLTALLLASPSAPAPASAADSKGFTFNWTGGVAPASPVLFNGSPNWDVSVHSRGMTDAMYPTLAQHGVDCSGPPSTHVITALAEAVYICNNHLMTSISDRGYGEVTLTPNQIVDFSKGPATISFDMSTLRFDARDWLTFWLTPWDQNMLHPFNEDYLGPPRNGFRLSGEDNAHITRFFAQEFTDFNVSAKFARNGTPLEQLLTPSANSRTRIEMTVSRTHVKFGVPSLSLWWVDNDFPAALPFNQAIFQINDESYNPCKGQADGPCYADTWHWSDVTINPAVPFTMLQSEERVVTPYTSPTVHFTSPAPNGSFLRFEAIGPNVRVGFTGGTPAAASQQQQQTAPRTDRWTSYWVPVPSGTTSVSFSAERWWGGDWWVRDPAIWSLAAPSPEAAAPVAQTPIPVGQVAPAKGRTAAAGVRPPLLGIVIAPFVLVLLLGLVALGGVRLRRRRQG